MKNKTKTTYTIEEIRDIADKDGNVDLSYSGVKTLPDDLVVEGYLDLFATKIEVLPKNLTVKGNLYLNHTLITTLPSDINIEKCISLDHSALEYLPNDLVIKGSIYMCGTRLKTLPDNFIVGGNLYLQDTDITGLPDDLVVGGHLDLSGSQISCLPENFTVGGSLSVESTRIRELPDNIAVGGNLNVKYTEIKTIPENAIVGSVIYGNRNLHRLHSRRGYKIGEYSDGRYLYADNILTHIKRKKDIGEYTYYIGKIPDKNVIYDGEYYAHCKSLRDGIQELEFKHAKDRGSEQYSHLSVDSVISKDEAITMYRIITGACKQGTEIFVDSLKDIKEEYTIREIIDLTKGQYGNETLRKFFNV